MSHENRHHINLGLTILLGCTLGMGAIGWYGSQRLADLLSYVLGAAWRAADGAMEGSIELGNQSLYIQKMLSGSPRRTGTATGKRSGQRCALRRVEQGRLIDAAAITTLKQHEQTYQQEQAQLLTLYRTFTSADGALRASSEHVTPLDQAGVIGDGPSSLTRSPDQAISWNGGLATRWQAADGGMEANIGFLRQLYALEKMQAKASLLPSRPSWHKPPASIRTRLTACWQPASSMCPATGSLQAKCSPPSIVPASRQCPPDP